MSQTLTTGRRRFVRHVTPNPLPRWYCGLDLGQRQDFSALATLELLWTGHGRCPVTFEFQFTPTLHIRALQRFPRGTSYEDLFNLVRSRLAALAPGTQRALFIDAAGPGAPIVDRLRSNLPSGLRLRPVLISGGHRPSNLPGGYTGLPRRVVVSTLQLLLAAKSLKADQKLPGLDILKEELLELSGDSSQPASSGAHDDLAIAVALGAWGAAQDTPELLPEPADAPARIAPSGHGPLF